MLGQIALALFILMPALATAQTSNDENWGGRSEMNDIKFSQYSDFQKKWQLVTVRFRKDTGELRFTYANPKALKALRAGSKDYPDGAVFAKFSAITQDDPAFPSSGVPSGARRVQYMVRNKAKYKDTGGWGYALFRGNGETYPEEPKASAMACAACHRVVARKGDVFSEEFSLYPLRLSGAAPVEPVMSQIRFVDTPIAVLPETLKQNLPKGTSTIRQMRVGFENHVFNGTLNEVRPALSAEAVKASRPTVFISADQKMFALIYVDPSTRECAKSGRKDMASIHTEKMADPQNPTKLIPVVQRQKFCW